MQQIGLFTKRVERKAAIREGRGGGIREQGTGDGRLNGGDARDAARKKCEIDHQ